MVSRGVALVTGASDGIGQAIAVRLAQEGYDLVVTSRDEERLAKTCHLVEAENRSVLALAMELADPSSIKETFARIGDEVGNLDVLVNNAAVLLHRPAAEISVDEWDYVLTINLRGTFLVSQQMANHLIAANRPGKIINIGSTLGEIAIPERGLYGVSKAGIHYLTRALALEWAEHNILVNCVAPATVETPSRRELLSDPEQRKMLLNKLPVGRFCTPEEIAGTVAFLTSDDAGFITGQVILLDGGLTLT